MIYFKIHEHQGEKLVAACDREIMGKTFSEGEIQFKIDEKFYGTELIKIKDFISILENSTAANLMGKRTVNAAIDHGFVDKDCVIGIAGIKHAQIVVV